MTPQTQYPQNAWAVRVATEKAAARKEARADKLEEAAWVGLLCLIVVVFAGIFAAKELPNGVQAVPVWIGEVVFCAAAAYATWRYDRITNNN